MSTEQQADAGVSLKAQRAKLEAYALATDLELVGVVEDPGLSGKTIQRPGLREVLARLDAGEADGVLVVKLDRLTRSVKDLAHLVERYFASRFTLLSVSDSIDTRSASGRLVLNVLCSVAQWEREATGERTRDALAQVKREGGRIGREPMGWRRSTAKDEHGRRLVEPDAEEGTIVAMIRGWHADGASIREITARLGAAGIRTKRGGRWHKTQVHRVLSRPNDESMGNHLVDV